MGTFSFSDFIRRGARAVINIARGIGAGYSGASSGGYGGAYGFGYRLGSRAKVAAVAAAVEAVKPVVTVRTAVAARATSRGGSGLWSTISSKIPSSITQLLTRRDLHKPEYYSGSKAAANSDVGTDIEGIAGSLVAKASVAEAIASGGACSYQCLYTGGVGAGMIFDSYEKTRSDLNRQHDSGTMGDARYYWNSSINFTASAQIPMVSDSVAISKLVWDTGYALID